MNYPYPRMEVDIKTNGGVGDEVDPLDCKIIVQCVRRSMLFVFHVLQYTFSVCNDRSSCFCVFFSSVLNFQFILNFHRNNAVKVNPIISASCFR